MSWIGKWKVKSYEQKYIPNSLKWLDKNITLMEIISQNFLACTKKGQYMCYNKHILCNIEINQLLRSIAFLVFPSGSAIMNCLQFKSCRRWGSIPELRRFLGGRNGNSLQYSFQDNSMDRGAWGAKGVAKSQTQLSNWAHTYTQLF